MNTLSFFLAWRYLRQTAHEQGSSTMIKIVFLSIALGTFALALVTAIMHGFEVTIHEKMQGIHSQLTIRSTDPIDMDSLSPVLANEFKQIEHFSPSMQEHILFKSPTTENVGVMMIIGIDPTSHANVSSLSKKITTCEKKIITLPEALENNKIIIGAPIAHSESLSIGDSVNLFYSQDLAGGTRKVTLESENAIIGGIFETGIDDFDGNVIFCSLDFFNSLFPNTGITNVSLALKPGSNDTLITKKLKERLDLDVVSWKDLYKPLVAALTLEKYAMFLILALITLVASMNIISLLFMLITKKRPDIAILRVVGSSSQTITHIFIWISMIIATISCVSGLIVAWACSYFLEKYPFIQLPDVYYVSHLPTKMTLLILVIVFLCVMLLCLIATLVATRAVRTIPIAHVLRFEG